MLVLYHSSDAKKKVNIATNSIGKLFIIIIMEHLPKNTWRYPP